MSNPEYKLKKLSVKLPNKLLVELEQAPLLPGEAGLISNLIFIPSDSKLEQDMHVQVKNIKKKKVPFKAFPEDIRIEFEKIRKDLKLKWDKEMKEIEENLLDLKDKLDSSVDNLEKKSKIMIDRAKSDFEEKAKTDREKKYLDSLRKYHDGLVNCLTVDNLSFLTKDGAATAENLINLQQLYQSEFKKRLIEENE
ncbi:hypothetical protein V7654_18820 [Bacillus sp. JJ1609]|uniref:hypothetical protein n=1 Tax=Bacillus sp. JJ1609 TaxID=3122977 RepID=UPI002FFE0493